MRTSHSGSIKKDVAGPKTGLDQHYGELKILSYGNNRLTFETLVSSIQQVHDQLATQATKAVNVSLTLRNWIIGLYIAEFELRGADRANYGDQLFSALAKQLTSLKVSNSNRRQLYRYLRFYKLYPEIVGTLSPQLRRLLPTETRSKKWGRRPHNCRSHRKSLFTSSLTVTWN